jgi:hypothetical protein
MVLAHTHQRQRQRQRPAPAPQKKLAPGGRAGQNRWMQEPGLRRLREGGRLGLFKNKVGLMRSKQSSELHGTWCGTWGFCLPTYRNTSSSQWRGWLGNRSRGTPSASTQQCNCGAGSYASQKHTISGRPTQQLGGPCARGMHGQRRMLRSAAHLPDPSICVFCQRGDVL